MEKVINKTMAFIQFLNSLCKPNPKHIPDEFLQEVTHNRNKAILWFEIAFIIIQVFHNITGVDGNAPLLRIAVCFFIIMVLLVSCKWHPQVFKIFYSLLVAAYGPYMLSQGNVHEVWIGVQVYPVCILFFTGSLSHYLVQISLQLIFLITLYEPVMLKAITYLSPEEFMSRSIYAMLLLTAFNIVFVTCAHQSLQNAYNKVMKAEKKKQEFEKQKIFLLGFSHELRNLINSVMGNVNLANLENSCEKVKDFLSNAEVCGKLLLHLVNNILDTGKVEIGDLEITPTPTRVYDAMENIWSICSELIKRKNLQGTMKIKNDIPQVLNMDHYRLTQIFLNLVGNAVKFTDKGSIDITVEWTKSKETINSECFEPKPFNDISEMDEGIFEKRQRFSVFDSSFLVLDLSNKKINKNLLHNNLNLDKGVLKVVVNDTGCGISQNELDRLFQKFTQVTPDLSKRRLGTGLGLFITKELCQRMKGDIQVFTRLGEGACFIFCIPLEPIPHQAVQINRTVSLQENHFRQGLKAMIVDDEHFSRFILKDFLTKIGVKVSEVKENGLEAYQKFMQYSDQKNGLNIVIMDLDMPIMDGKKASIKIREFEQSKGIEPCLLIIASANCSKSEIKECVDKRGRIRANIFLKKPVTIDELSRAIDQHFSSKNAKI